MEVNTIVVIPERKTKRSNPYGNCVVVSLVEIVNK
jgi:hypothetical protein